MTPVRFVYCAAVISYMLGDFSGIDIDRAVDYITKFVRLRAHPPLLTA